MKKKSFLRILSYVLVLTAFLAGAALYETLPSEIPVHWNIQGEVDDTMTKPWGVFLLPLVMLFAVVLFELVPQVDPLKENIEKFRKHYDGLIFSILLFLGVLHGQILLWSFGVRINPSQTMPVLIGLLFLYIGSILPHAKRNWFVGIRTPWTLSSDHVWERTHRAGEIVFRISGILMIVSVFLPTLTFFVVIGLAVGGSLGLVVYSYLLWRKERSG